MNTCSCARLTKQPLDRRFQHEPLPPVSLLRPAPLLTAATPLSPVYPLLHSDLSVTSLRRVTLLKLLPSSQVDSAEQRFVLGERTLSGNLVAPPRSPEPPDPPVPPDLLHSPLNRTSTHPYRPFRSMNTQLDRYVPNLALRAGSPPLQDWCSNVEILVEENVSRLVSLQYLANQSFEDWLLIVKVWVVICFVDVQPFLFTSGGLSTPFIYEIRRHRGVEAKLNQICLAGRVYCSTKSENDWCDIPLSKTLYWNFKSKFRHFRPSGHCYGVSQLLAAMLSNLFEIHIVSSESSVGVSTDFAGLMGCSATSSSSTGSFAVQTYLFGLFNVDSDYFLLAAVSIVSRVQVKSFQRHYLNENGKLVVLVFFATPASFSSSLLPLSPILLLSICSDIPFSFGLLRLAGDLTTARRASINPLEEKRDLGVHGLSEMESVAASPGAFLTVLQTLCRRFANFWSVHDVEAIVEVYSVARSVSLHSSAYGAFGSGELLLFADRQGILGCPVVKPPWRLESLTFAVALA
ncbi:hypothetical protein HID58_085152 [Brassica napus]|uniref:Uncharacterized protein n=1 Tax=Brassica napus TaxID=3708 RepID=A0ABQ7XLT0_BRANA|nr:hypothetical protein HID58_085152 [Brassica napus]